MGWGGGRHQAACSPRQRLWGSVGVSECHSLGHSQGNVKREACGQVRPYHTGVPGHLGGVFTARLGGCGGGRKRRSFKIYSTASGRAVLCLYPLKFICCGSGVQCGGVRRWAFGTCTGHSKGEALKNGTSDLIKGPRKRPSATRGHSGKLRPGRCPVTGSQPPEL